MPSTPPPWFMCYQPQPTALVRLICFPHGGGGPHAFREWSDHLPESVEVLALNPPGRGSRFNEPLISDMEDLVSRIIEALHGYFDKPFFIFGHSIGAAVCLATARRLRKAGLPQPLGLFVSALAPETPDPENAMYRLPDEELARLIRDLELVPGDVLDNDELLSMIVPPMKADFQACETYAFPGHDPLPVPILGLGGDDDHLAGEADMQKWARFTSAAFQVKTFRGGHFYTQTCRAELLIAIAGSIAQTLEAVPKSVVHGPEESYPVDKCLHELFREQAAKTGRAVAVVDGNVKLTFGELDVQTDLLARYLQAQGVGVDSLAGIYMEPCLEFVIAYIAILKAGGAYLPIDADYPDELLKRVLTVADPVVVCTKDAFFDRLPAERQGARRAFVMSSGWNERLQRQSLPALDENREKPEPSSLAYGVMSSGSTGTPKGILCPHKGAVNSYHWRYTHYPYEQGEREASNVFFVWEVIRPILQGFPAYIIPDDVIYDPPRVVDFLSENRISRVLFTPSLLEQILNTPDLDLAGRLCHLRIVYLNGEVVTTALRNRFLKLFPNVTLLNDYSISESHDICTTDLADLNPALSPRYTPVGRPMSNVYLYLLDDDLTPVPMGCAGELYVGGHSVAREYLKEPLKTAERFVPDPVRKDGSIVFRTGDAGRFLPDGQLELHGRIAFMIKLRGYSIVPGAVETAILEYPGIQAAVVVTIDNKEAGQPEHLAAYVVQDGNRDDDVLVKLRSHLKKELPHYAVPAYIIPLPYLPIASTTGKLDRKKLPDPDETVLRVRQRDDMTPPAAGLEREMAGVWEALLKVKPVGADDNFFDLGGHSLLAAKLCTELRGKIKQKVSVVDVFQHPTVRALSRYLTHGEEIDLELAAKPLTEDSSIAIVGMSCRFPGAGDIDTFWRNLRDGIRSIREFSEVELRQRGIPKEIYSDANYVKSGAVLDDVDLFDVKFWGISQKEALLMDPQHRLLLECCREAMENAGYAPRGKNPRTGVFAGCFLPLYMLHHLGSGGLTNPMDPIEQHLTEIGNDKDYLASRVSYLLNLNGPAVSVQTSCSTALTSVASACQSILSNQCDMALAGASSLIFPQAGYLYAEGHINSKDGHCRPFDANASGTILGDGVGVVVLKRLADAVADNDSIYAVIKGFAVNNDGDAKAGYSAPGVQGQARVIAAAQAMAGITPETVSYVECHGTGTPIGDPIEVRALTEVFGRTTEEKQFCAIGSVKANIGHSNIAAGLSGLIKTVLALKHAKIPPSIDFETPNPELNLESSPFYVNDKLRDWHPAKDAPRRAGVSCFGIGGTNCHMVLDEWDETRKQTSAGDWSKLPAKRYEDAKILSLSAKTAGSLEESRQKLILHFMANPGIDPDDAAYTLHVGRELFQHRLAVSCGDIASAITALKNAAPSCAKTEGKNIVFMFSGGGAQYLQMGYGLYRQEPLYRKYYDECCAFINPIIERDLQSLIYAEEGTVEAETVFSKAYYLQPAIFSAGYALARTLMAWGIRPTALVGHSLGEYTAACIGGILDLEDALTLVMTRSLAIENAPEGAMLSVNMTEAAAREFIDGKKEIWLAVINSSRDMVLSGTCEAIDRAEKELRRKDILCRPVRQSKAYHTPVMEDAARALRQKDSRIQLNKPAIPVMSNLSGDWFSGVQAGDPAYWGEHMKRPVLFSENIQGILKAQPDIMLEVGPGRILCNLAIKIASDLPDNEKSAGAPLILASMRHPQETQVSDTMFLGQTLARLWTKGVEIDWHRFYAEGKHRRIALPSYAFEKERVWPDEKQQQIHPESGDPKLPMEKWFYIPSWTRSMAKFQASGSAEKQVSNEPLQWLAFIDDDDKDRGRLGELIAGNLEKSGDKVVRVYRSVLEACDPNRLSIPDPSYEQYRLLLNRLASDKKYPCRILYLWGLSEENGTDPENPQERLESCYNFLHLARALTKASRPDPLSVWVITDRAVQVSQERIIPEKAMLTGAGTVLSQENPHIACRILDVQPGSDRTMPLAGLAEQILQECTSEDPGKQAVIALRGYHRWTPCFENVPFNPGAVRHREKRLHKDGVYIITGGLGRIGLALAGHLARLPAKLILTTRSEFPAKSQWETAMASPDTPENIRRTIQKLTSHEKEGAQVIVYQADMGLEGDVEHLLAATAEQFERIDGVFHAAGIADLKYLPDLGDDILAQEFAPKVYGTWYLDRAISGISEKKGIKPGFVFLFSSVASVLGGLAMGAYSPANCFLDAFFQENPRRNGVTWINVNWDDWDFEYSKEQTEAYEKSGVKKFAMSPEDGLEILDRIVEYSSPVHLLISTHPLMQRVERWVYQKENRFNETVEEPEKDVFSPDFPASEELTGIEAQISSSYRKVLGAENISVDDNFFDLGGDSLLATQILLNLRKEIPAAEIQIRDIFTYPTIRQLAGLYDSAEAAGS